MTARMIPKQYRYNYKNESLVADFLQTVQLNYDLDEHFMYGVDIHQKDAFGQSALYWAIYHHNMHNVKTLLNYGSTLDVAPGLKAPFCAVKFDNLEVISYLVDKGIDIHMRHSGETLVEYVREKGSCEMQGYFDALSSVRSGG